jgi:hypothetical protein
MTKLVIVVILLAAVTSFAGAQAAAAKEQDEEKADVQVEQPISAGDPQPQPAEQAVPDDNIIKPEPYLVLGGLLLFLAQIWLLFL